MKVTVFTSNQPRHIHLVQCLVSIADEVFVVQESSSIYPGQVPSFFSASEIKKEYFARVHKAEINRFGDTYFLPEKCRSMSIYPGDLKIMKPSDLGEALDVDYFIIFGTGIIAGDLLSHLTRRSAINIHMGAAPWYRGASYFWTLYDGHLI